MVALPLSGDVTVVEWREEEKGRGENEGRGGWRLQKFSVGQLVRAFSQLAKARNSRKSTAVARISGLGFIGRYKSAAPPAIRRRNGVGGGDVPGALRYPTA